MIFCHWLYKLLQSIITLSQSFHIYIIDFIVTLSKIKEDFNSIISLTDKFSKAVIFMPDKIT